MGNLYGCATNTNKSSTNQDYCTTVKNERLNFSGVIVADGIGSHFKSEISSKFCCNKLKELLEGAEHIEQIDMEKLYKDVKLALIEFAKKSDEFDFNSIDKHSSLGTTLICALDFSSEYILAYAGNGSIWFVDGRFNKFGKNFFLPWNSINLLNPHSVEQEGKAALYRFISVSDNQHKPTVIKLSKNPFSPGEIIIAATDGVFSNDAVPVGKDANNTIWIKGEETMPILYTHLSKFLTTRPNDVTTEDLENSLKQYLIELKDRSIMHDDTTLGVIISERTLDYHQKLTDTKSALTSYNEENSNK